MDSLPLGQVTEIHHQPHSISACVGQAGKRQMRTLQAILVFYLCILGKNIKSLPEMVTDLWAFVYPIGYYGIIELQPIKSRNEDAVF